MWFKKKYGFPCRHLFCIEPKYNTQDIHCIWQKAFSVYTYSHGKRDITQAYKKLTQLQHLGISIKEGNALFKSHETGELNCNVYPSIYGNKEQPKDQNFLNTILNIHSNPVPTCWNYMPDEIFS